MMKSSYWVWTARASDGDLLLPAKLLHIILDMEAKKKNKHSKKNLHITKQLAIIIIIIFLIMVCEQVQRKELKTKTYLTHALDFNVFSVEVLFKFWQLI